MPEWYDPMFLPALGGPTRAWQIARMIVDAYDKQRLTQPDSFITAVDHLDELSRIVYTPDTLLDRTLVLLASHCVPDDTELGRLLTRLRALRPWDTTISLAAVMQDRMR